MTKFNKRVAKAVYHTHDITDAKERLTNMVLNSFVFEGKFYGDTTNDIKDFLPIAGSDFVSKLALFAREQYGLRSVSHLLLAELSHFASGQPGIKDVIARGIVRPDDMTEIMSYQINTYGKPIPASMKKGLAQAFTKFNEYGLQKYNRDGNVTLKDVMCLVKPAPSNEDMAKMWGRLLEDNLVTPTTWETTLSNSKDERSATQKWEDLINSNSLGYMAMMRNLRNIIEANVSYASIKKVAEKLSNQEEVMRSKQFPFRFYSAYNSIKGIYSPYVDTLTNALGEAIGYSAATLPKFEGKTLIAMDSSSSMRSNRLSGNSTVYTSEIAALFSAMSQHLFKDFTFGQFDRNFRYTPELIQTHKSILKTTEAIINSIHGGATYTADVFRVAINDNKFYDRFVLFTDNMANSGYNSSTELIKEYRRKVNPNVKIYLIDLCGYGKTISLEKDVHIISGWSDKVFQYLHMIDNGEISSLVETISNYK